MSKTQIRAVVYVRFSSHLQNDSFTIEYQLDETKRHIKNKGYKFVKAYIDAAKSGKKTAGRDSFDEMIRDAARGMFDKIIVFSFSRSFRNTRDALNYNYELMEKHNVILESVIEPIDFTNPHGKFSGTNLFAMHELQSDIIANHVKAGMYIAAQKGYFLGGFVPFGYELYETGETSRGRARKKYRPHPTEAPIIKKMFELYAGGFSHTYILNFLNETGARGRKGGKFRRNVIAQMLRNQTYIGIREYKLKGYEPLYIEGGFPALIDAETWAKVQERHNKNDLVKPRKRQRLYALTGKIVCKKCGGFMTGSARGIGKYKYEYYRCANKEAHKNCDMRNVRKDLLEEYAMKQIKQHILNENAIKEIAKEILTRIESAPDDLPEKIKKASKRREKINGIIKKIRRDIYENEIDKETGDEMIKEYNDELLTLDLQLNEMQAVVNSQITAEKIENYLNELLLMTKSKDDEIIKNLFDNLIEKIDVHPDKVELFLNVAPINLCSRNVLKGQPLKSLRLNVKREKISGFNSPAYKK